MANLLDVLDLSVDVHVDKEKKRLLKNIHFSLNHGETLALVGESGSGKSLTALAIIQLLPLGLCIAPQSSILFEHKDLLTFSEMEMRKIRGRKIALVFQEAITALNPVLTIGEQLIEVINYHFKMNRKEVYKKAVALLTEVGIPNPAYHLRVYPHQLSGGLKQRAMIALALAGEPELLIADEPTTALDVTLQAQIIELLKKIQQTRGMGLIFITHDLGIVYEIADQVVVLLKGEVVESKEAKSFFKAPEHPYSRKLFESLPGWVEPLKRYKEETEETILSVQDLKVYYPIKKGIFKRTVGYIKAVDDISLNVKAGRTLALVGESGSGKTTTGMAILRLTGVTSGQIIFNHLNLATLSSRQLRKIRGDLQVVFQDPYGSMNPRMLIRDIIAEGMSQHTLDEEVERVDDLLCYVGLDPEAKFRYPHEFSGGQRQRICIARALVAEPKLLICDEPTSALDVSAQMQILKLLVKLQKEKGLAYLLITHNIAVVDYMADDVAVMHKGKIVEMGPASDILKNPRDPYTQKLLAAVPTVPKNF